MRSSYGHLFGGGELRDALEQRTQRLLAEIDALAPDSLLSTPTEVLVDHFEDTYRVDPPELRTAETKIDQSEAKLDVSADPSRDIRDRGQPFYVTGTRINFCVPFSGDPEFLRYSPAQRTLPGPSVGGGEGEIVISVERTDHDSEAARHEFDQQLGRVSRWIQFVAHDLQIFNNGLREKARGRIDFRRQKLLADRHMTASLGFPLRRSPAVSSSYTVPVQRRQIRPLPAGARPGAKFSPEPAIEMAIHEEILSMVRSMAQVMERNPSTFARLSEEEIRDHFLMVLNSQFQGAATGETFNFTGKTDILIRDNGKNLFIAECKFWRGPKALGETIDQLLGYAQWRDCKLAILIFNKNKDFTNVLTKIREAARQHSAFRRETQYGDETCFRFTVRHRDDERREMTLTVVCFEVPAPEASGASPADRPEPT